MSGKNLVLEKNGKKGKSGRGSWANRSQNSLFPIYLEFGSSDFDETMKRMFSVWQECCRYEKNVLGMERMF